MMRALYTAATGMIAEQTNVDTIANNLANVNTTGFKAERTEFKSLLYQTLQTKTTTANGEQKPIGAQVGLGTRVAATTTSFKQGNMQTTESETDFALEGDGFFAIRNMNGEICYTRNGNFQWSIDGNGNTLLTNKQGFPVLDTNGNAIYLPNGVTTQNITFSESGEIGYRDAVGNNFSMNQSFGIYQFSNPGGLDKLSNNLLRATDASGAPLQEGTQQGIKRSRVCQNYLEMSNVSVADEMVNMIIAQRAYELNSKAITTADSMLDTANNLKR